MIIQIEGNVSYPITLDPSVWIFDKRKVLFEEAFTNNSHKKSDQEDTIKKQSKRYEREVFQHKGNENENISKREGEEILKNTYCMPIYDFILNAEVNENAKEAQLITGMNKDVTVTIDELENGYLLFAKDGKPIKDEGPVYFYYGDGSNKANPIKNVTKIVIV